MINKINTNDELPVHQISLEEAKELTKNFRTFNIHLGLPIAESFQKEELLSLLNNPECKQLKIYYGLGNLNDPKKARMVLCGVNAQGNDMLEVILENGILCPPTCDPKSPLANDL